MCLQGSMHARLTWVPTHNPVVGAEGTTESSATTSSTMVSMTPGQDVNVRNHYRHIISRSWWWFQYVSIIV